MLQETYTNHNQQESHVQQKIFVMGLKIKKHQENVVDD